MSDFPIISTKTGDGGITRLWSGESVAKNHPAIRCQSECDAFDSEIGLIYDHIGEYKELHRSIKKIQRRMLHLKGEIATHPISWGEFRKNNKPITKKDVEYLDMCSENIRQNLADTGYKLDGFVLYGDEGPISARFDHLRAECRRCEVSLYDLDDILSNASISSEIKQFINRLSDYFYLLARYTRK